MRAPFALAGLLAAALFAALPASAHTSDSAPISGVLDVAPQQTQAVVIAALAPGDTLEWNWSVSSGAELASGLAWTDTSGAAHAVNTSGLPYGRFEAPSNLVSARLEWTNAGSTPASVEWNYVCSASFWSQPGLVLPAAVPFILLCVALVAGRLIDGKAKTKGHQKEKAP